MHVINCTPVINKAMVLVKPFINTKLYNALKFHNIGSYDSLYKHVPREILPSDYGGDAQSMAELKQYWVEILADRHEFLIDDSRFAFNEEIKHRASEDQKIGGILSFLTS